ncbi:MAG: AI-2E family transporter [Geminicoccaceae bacterium]
MQPLSDMAFARRVLIVLALVALALLLWELRDVLLLVFAAVIVAVVLRACARPLVLLTGWPRPWPELVATLLLAAVLAGMGWLIGAPLRQQAVELAQRLPDAWSAFEQQLGVEALGPELLERVTGAGNAGSVLGSMLGVASTLAGVTANLLVVLVGGVYLAVQPRLYREGLVRLVPGTGTRERVDETLAAVGRALRLWLLGRLAAMVMIGILIGAGLWLIGLPNALALALFAGLVEFVPLAGPVLGAVPALLIALTQGWAALLWTFLLVLLVQQVEGNVVSPLIERQAVSLPPALTLFAVIAAGVLFGPLGVMLAAPITVVAFVAVGKLWVRETLGEPATVPGEPAGAASA